MALEAYIRYFLPRELEAHVTGCTPGYTYYLEALNQNDTQIAVGTTLTLDMLGNVYPDGYQFLVTVTEAQTSQTALGSTVYAYNDYADGPFRPNAVITQGTWFYDGDKTITWTADLLVGTIFYMDVYDSVNGLSEDQFTSLGGEATYSLTLDNAPTDGVNYYSFRASIFLDTDGSCLGMRVFFPGGGDPAGATSGTSGSPRSEGTSATFEYDGASTAVLTFQSQEGVFYCFKAEDQESTAQEFFGTGLTMAVLIEDIGGVDPGVVVSMYLKEGGNFQAGSNFLACSVFTFGSPGTIGNEATWDYDGIGEIEVEFASVPGRRYYMQGVDAGYGGFDNYPGQIAFGTTTELTLDITDFGQPIAVGEGFMVQVYDADDPFSTAAVRLFQTGRANEGYDDLTPGSPVPIGPGATTTAASNITATSVQLNSLVNPGGVPAIAYFQYGVSPSFGEQSAPISVGSGDNPIPFSQEVSILPNHRYYFRAVMEQL